jgi:hypothetical protein
MKIQKSNVVVYSNGNIRINDRPTRLKITNVGGRQILARIEYFDGLSRGGNVEAIADVQAIFHNPLKISQFIKAAVIDGDVK